MHPHLSVAIAKAWRGRAHGEARVGRAFTRIIDSFPDGELSPQIREALGRAAVEEAHHAELCDGLARGYAEIAARPADDGDEVLPLATPAERAVMLVSASCVSESIATAYLERCWAQAKAPVVRAVLHELLADEVGHAQLGWAYVAGLPADSPERAAIARSARGVVERTRLAWRGRISELHALPSPEHGYPPADELCAIVDEAASGLVLRGFAHVGVLLPSEAAR